MKRSTMANIFGLVFLVAGTIVFCVVPGDPAGAVLFIIGMLFYMLGMVTGRRRQRRC